MATAKDVAEYLVWLAEHDDSEPMTNLKVQKLLYYVQGFHLAIDGKPLFNDLIEAWIHGPAVSSVFHQYKTHGSDRIQRTVEVDQLDLTPEQKELINDVYRVYGQFSAGGLRNLTHSEPPWLNTPQGQPITLSAMKDFFSTQVSDGD